MSEDSMLILIVGLLIILFVGEPDLQDALIAYLFGEAQ